MYFETGQGSALSSQRPPWRRPTNAGGESLCSGTGFRPVVGEYRGWLYGPEYLFNGKQILFARAWKTISVASYLAYPWGVISATPII